LNADSEQSREQDDSLQTEFLAFVMLRLCSPVQERDDVLCHLRRGGGGAYGWLISTTQATSSTAGPLTVIVLNKAIEQDTSHGDGTTGEVRVVVHAIADLNTGGRIHVTGQKREDVVLGK
jgi:hypothetical protein